MKAKLLIDKREQIPLVFNNTEKIEIVSKSSSFGYYCLDIDGKIVCSVERKAIGDLVGSLTTNHKNFKEEIARAKESGILFFVVVEDSYHNFINKKFKGSYHSSTPGYVLAKIMHTMYIRGVIFHFFNNREEMRDFIRNTFTAFINEHERTKPII